MLLDNGTDLHSFQPAVKDIMKVSGCDLLIYVGGESDEWIEDALKSAQNKNMKTINLMEVLADSIKEEETVEGMQENEHGHEHEDEKEYDEHVWTSPSATHPQSVMRLRKLLQKWIRKIKISIGLTKRLIRKNLPIWMQNIKIRWKMRNKTHFCLRTVFHFVI